MNEINAREKHPCPSCGGESVWNPAKQALVCPFCGTTSAASTTEGEIKEHDLVTALRAIPDDQRGWNAEKRSVKCQHCQAITVFDPGRVAQKCDFCGSAQLVDYEETKQPFRPESVLSLSINENQARDNLKAWYKKVWFAPNNLSKIGTADTFKGIYLPFWTFDAHVEAEWNAEAGHYYYTTESYTDSQGKRSTRQVRHTRWEYASGHISHFFDDELIPASRGIQAQLISGVSPFPTQDLKPYDPSFVAGWVVEHYQIDLVEAAQQSRSQMESKTRALCASEIPGDTYRNLQVASHYSKQSFKHILAPIWLVTYTYGATSYQVLVNGVTGKVSGRYPKSWIKITLAVLAAVIAIVVVLVVANQR